jgi:hypothetical protein
VLLRVAPAVLAAPPRALVRLAPAALAVVAFAAVPRFVPPPEAPGLAAMERRLRLAAVVRPLVAAEAVAALPLPARPARPATPLARADVSSTKRVRRLEPAAAPPAALAFALRVGVLAMRISSLHGSAPRESVIAAESSVSA